MGDSTNLQKPDSRVVLLSRVGTSLLAQAIHMLAEGHHNWSLKTHLLRGKLSEVAYAVLKTQLAGQIENAMAMAMGTHCHERRMSL